MIDRCDVPRCRREVEIVYLERGVCGFHWDTYMREDAPTGALRDVLGIEPEVPTAKEGEMAETVIETNPAATAATDETMAVKRNAKKSSKKARAARSTKAKHAKASKPKGDKPGRVFAIRVTDAELAAIHKAAGPRNASRFIRQVAAAFAKSDEAAFRAVLKDAQQARQ